MSDVSERRDSKADQPLSADRWKTLEPLIDAALELPPGRRPAFIAERCGGDAALRVELERLLTAYDGPSLLDHTAAKRFPSLFDEGTGAVPEILNGHYRIDREIGRGGTATVYLAHDLRHDRKVAVKVLHPELAAALGSERFLAEIRTTAQLHHPNILPLHDSGNVDGLLFFVMPYMEGESLRHRLEREKQLPLEDAVRITREVAGALDSAHRQGVIHRDIKPENILLHDGVAVLADFGIALALRAATADRLTMSGITVGTPQYMSPEQALGDRIIDSRSDIYSLATVLYEMLAGEPPFTGATRAAIMAKLLAGGAPSLRIVRPAIPEGLDAVVLRALTREPADRYGTPGEFADALQESLAQSTSNERRARAQTRGGKQLVGRALIGAALLALVGAGVLFIGRAAAARRRTLALGEQRAPGDGLKSIAVLPLGIVGTDTANNYFAEGMTDELSSALGKVPGIRVVAGRSAAFLFKGKDPDFRDLGRKLGVTTLLQGGVRREGNRIRATIQLVSTGDGSTLWTNSYSHEVRGVNDVFTMRDDVVKDIVGQLRITLVGGGAQVTQPIHRSSANLKAYDLYLQGRYFLSQRRPNAADKALQYFRLAIAADSNFADAWSGISDVYTAYGLGNEGAHSPNEYFPKARAAAKQALALDSSSAAAHASLGEVKIMYDFDWAGGERELARSLELDPRNTVALDYRTILLEFIGRFDEAVAHARLAVQNDPFGMLANIELGRALFFARRYEAAKAQLSRVLERDSTRFRAYLLLGQVFEQTGKPDSAVAAMQTAVHFSPNSARSHAFLAHAYAMAGRPDDALRELAALQVRARSAYVAPFDFAVIYEGLGRMDDAFERLGKSVDDHSIRPYLMDPTFDPIRSDPRYQQLLRKLHHPLATTLR